MKYRLTFFGLLLSSLLFCQDFSQPSYTPASERIESFSTRKALQENSLVGEVPFRSIGPTVFSGRISDLDVWEKDPSHFYAAYASGGLWKTENNGMTFKPIFDHEMVLTMGDIAVDWERDVIWVGTGEVNSSRSSYSGVGMYKSSDGGKTWEHKGLEESHHIGRIILHPHDPNTLWVAVLGHLYSPNEERGIYKTTDGGKTWKKTLFVNENAGAIDLVMDESNPNILYAATWDRTRRSWNFVESGAGSGIYKSTDGGENWTILNTEDSGFPNGEGVGRIGLDITKQDGKTVLYAILDNYFRRPKDKEEDKSEDLTKDDLRNMSKDDFVNLEKEQIEKYLEQNNFPEKYSLDKVMEMIQEEEIKPVALVEYVENANSLLFDTPVIGAEVYRSDDEGKTWKKMNDDYLDNVYNSYGYYFGQIRVSPHNAEKIYIMGVPVLRSDDAGRTWESINGDNVHADHHALWLNPSRDKHIILGNDGGVNISYDDGEQWNKCNSPSVGQFYYVAVDMAKPYNVYGGLQDNGVWAGSKNYREGSTRWHGSGQYPYKSIMGGDGMQVAVDTRDNNTAYTGFQFGNYFRINQKSGKRTYITPKHDLGDRPLRWNWQTPIHLSIHNQDIFYMGSNKLHRSFDQGDNFHEISEDLTKGGIKGDVPFGTLACIHESPLKFGLIYTGSDDGLMHVTKDGGNSWENITAGLPENMWVARVQASQYEEGRVYAALNGYRWDVFEPYFYVSEDYGKNWKRIGADLPKEPANVIKEDPQNPNLIYVGTDHGLYISLDRGATFMAMKKDFPDVSVHDIVIHPRDNEMLVGTHGRSLYLADVELVQQLVDSVLQKDLFAFSVNKIRASSRWGNTFSPWREAPEPDITLPIFSKNGGKANLKLKAKDLVLKSWEVDLRKGLNYLSYHGTIDSTSAASYENYLNEQKKKDAEAIKVEKAKNGKFYLKKGKYMLEIEKDEVVLKKRLELN